MTVKKEILLLTKADILNESEKKEKIKIMKKINKDVLIVSIHDLDSLKAFHQLVLKTLE